jgi:hypothetical protein
VHARHRASPWTYFDDVTLKVVEVSEQQPISLSFSFCHLDILCLPFQCTLASFDLSLEL